MENQQIQGELILLILLKIHICVLIWKIFYSYFTEKVRLGSTANPYNLESGKLCDVAKVIQHPDYNDSNPEKGNSYLSLIEWETFQLFYPIFSNRANFIDWKFCRLNQTVEFSYNIRPACLFSNTTLPDIKISSISCTKNRRHKSIFVYLFKHT